MDGLWSPTLPRTRSGLALSIPAARGGRVPSMPGGPGYSSKPRVSTRGEGPLVDYYPFGPPEDGVATTFEGVIASIVR